MRRVLDQVSHLKSTSKVLTPPCFTNKLLMYEGSVRSGANASSFANASLLLLYVLLRHSMSRKYSIVVVLLYLI